MAPRGKVELRSLGCNRDRSRAGARASNGKAARPRRPDFYILNAKGEYAGVPMYASRYAVCTENGPQTLPSEVCCRADPGSSRQAAGRGPASSPDGRLHGGELETQPLEPLHHLAVTGFFGRRD